jgi:hypothetical protein
MEIQGPQQRQSSGEAFLGLSPMPVVLARVIDLL